MIEYQIAVGLAMLAFASYFDLKRREVDDRLWVFFSSLGVSFWLYEFLVSGTISNWWLALVSVSLTGGVAWLLYYLGFYGGADAKALFALSIILPLYHPMSVYLHPFASVMTLTNATIWVLALPFYFLLRNLYQLLKGEAIFSGFEEERWWKRAAVLFLGYRLRNVKESDFYLPLEKTIDGRRRFDLTLLKDEDEFLHGRDVWGTPGIPLLLFLTFGFITLILLGDLVTIFLDRLFSLLLT